MLGLVAALTLAFSPYGPAFSSESAIAPPIDPQVFVKDATAQAAIGPQSIPHDKGYRPALVSSDPPDVPLFSANGAPLGITLGRWVGANGTLDITPLNKDAETVTVRLSGLSPYGVYSVFVIAPASSGELSPADGTGAGNTLQADVGGTATTSMLVSPPIALGSSVVVIFHSDGASHGPSAGAPGVTSHAQLIARIPR